ncbi:cobalt-precorrin-3B C(17)-methyltransferase [mine drainage metagenome]|uniref:Cobalt-precorrin-3B C(17)-methyltransferase n=1 Tax=mine drainage metagenome TaxID=410659 RepID=A0A1J5Q7L6_9ZZZZ
MIGLIAVTSAGRGAAHELANAWPGETVLYEETAAQSLPAAFAECSQVVAFLAAGAVIRLVSPLLKDKHTDPAVVCVDEGRHFAISLLGGHSGGANALAERVAEVLGVEPIVTTASDAVGICALDQLGWPVEGDVAGVGRAMLDGESIGFSSEGIWPIPALPENVAINEEPTSGRNQILVTDRLVESGPGLAVLRPPSLVVGVGASRGVSADEVLELIDSLLADAQLSAHSVRHLATIDVKADEVGLIEAAKRRGWTLHTYPATALVEVAVPNPSERVMAEVGTASVAEASALFGGGTLLVGKNKSHRDAPMATVAIARHDPRGRLAIIGLGPGARDLLTLRAKKELRRASVVVGLDQYVEQIDDLLRPGTRLLATGLGNEEERARSAIAEAKKGYAVALIGSGDAGVYGMASPALEDFDGTFDVVGVPGITAATAASSLLGAPMGHDHCSISLSDLHTRWPISEKRIKAAAEGDFVFSFYNPRSKGRDWQLDSALTLLAEHRPETTPVGLVRAASRSGESVTVTTLGELVTTGTAAVDMFTLVLVGNSYSRLAAGQMVTPRGYGWKS